MTPKRAPKGIPLLDQKGGQNGTPFWPQSAYFGPKMDQNWIPAGRLGRPAGRLGRPAGSAGRLGRPAGSAGRPARPARPAWLKMRSTTFQNELVPRDIDVFGEQTEAKRRATASGSHCKTYVGPLFSDKWSTTISRKTKTQRCPFSEFVEQLRDV